MIQVISPPTLPPQTQPPETVKLSQHEMELDNLRDGKSMRKFVY